MTRRRSFVLVLSFALSAFLIVVVVKVGKIDLHTTLQQLENVNRGAFAILIALTGLHVILSNLKWRKIDAFLRGPSDSVPSGTASFVFTSTGVALGQVLPVQLSMSAARTLGTYFYGSPLKRGTAGTLFEQSFDVLIVGFLAVASGITWFCKGGGVMWTVSAGLMTLLALLAVKPTVHVVRKFLSRASAKPVMQNRILRRFADLEQSGFLDVGLARKLMMLSAARFVVQVLMAGEVVQAVGAHIPVWKLAAAIPLVTVAHALSITPGGLGISELTYVVMLHLFGIPVVAGARWALENRLLVATSCFVIGGCGAIIHWIGRIFMPSTSGATW